MVAVVMSGVIGRFIYIQIPRTIEGRELNLNEIREMRQDIEDLLNEGRNIPEEDYQSLVLATQQGNTIQRGNLASRIVSKYLKDRKTIARVKEVLKKNNMGHHERKKVVKLVKNELSLNNRIERLQTMRKLFKYWHVAHLPFALIMLIIMIIHVSVTLALGYRWIF